MIDERFQWDDRKAAANRKKHGISFREATGVFDDPLAAIVSDSNRSRDEYRYVVYGFPSNSEILLAVAYSFRGQRIRIISARRATSQERRIYMNKQFDRISDIDAADDYELPDEIDFRGAVRGLVYIPGTVALRLDDDVAKHFRNGQQVNAALRQLIAEGRAAQFTN